ncbi:BIM1 [Candida theae]|uniref:BIM1 n=1 Tax=Candida theae TaxID=1198502 RepID=A0AAD5BEF7_9ASCO|nr:BIM1 [Candida theae]KAI5958115.1 BIM1 [Candida theae]
MVVGESRTELLQWLNTILDLNYTKIEQCGTGAAFCQLMDSIAGGVALNKVKFNANTEYAYRHNWKILQSEFNKHRITKNIDVERLIKCRLQDNLDLLQWFKRYWNENADVNKQYDALSKRNGLVNGGGSSPYSTLNSMPNATMNEKSTLKQLGPPAGVSTTANRRRQVSQSPRIGNTVNRSSSGYGSDHNMQFSGTHRVNSDPIEQERGVGGGGHFSSTPQNQHSKDVLSSNYTSSNMSARVRPRKSVTPTTSSKVTTPVQQSRRSSDRSVRRVPSQLGGGGGGSGSGDTLSSFQTTPSATVNVYTHNGNHGRHSHANSSNSTNGSMNGGGGNGGNNTGHAGDNGDNNHGYHITNEEVEQLLERNEQLETQLTEYKLNCDTLQVERNFYFNKCRDIEILVQNIEGDTALVSQLDVLTLLKKIEDTLYATQEGFSSVEVHNVAIDGGGDDDGMLDNEF